jgi:hypothetical protein
MPLGASPLLGPGLVNIGTLSGGVAANVVAPAAEAGLLFRTVEAGEALLAEVERVVGGLAAIEVDAMTDPCISMSSAATRRRSPASPPTPLHLGIGPVVLAGPDPSSMPARASITFEQLAAGVDLYTDLAGESLPRGLGGPAG